MLVVDWYMQSTVGIPGEDFYIQSSLEILVWDWHIRSSLGMCDSVECSDHIVVVNDFR